MLSTTVDLNGIGFDRYAGPSSMSFRDVNGVTYFMSYNTLIGVRLPDGTTFTRRNSWGVTTGKHLNAIDGDNKASRLDADAFRAAVADALS